MLKASLESEPILVIMALASFCSALTIVYVNSKRKAKTFPQVSGPQTVSFSPQARNIMYQDADSQILGLHNLQRATSTDKSIVLKEKMIENSHVSKDKASLETALMSERRSTTGTSELASFDILASSTRNSVFSEEFEVVDLPCSAPLHSEVETPQSVLSATRMSELQVEQCLKETNSGFELPLVTVETKSNMFSSSVLNDAPVEKKDHENPDQHFRESVREDLYTFYDDNLSVTKSMSNLTSPERSSSHFSILDGKSFSSLIRSTMLKEAEFSSQDSFPDAENVDGEIPLISSLQKDIRKSRGFPRDSRRRILRPNGYRKPSLSNVRLNIHVTEKCNSSVNFSAYNNLLRKGRLIDCIELLEDMERSGVLDMNKVYHARFFKLCKPQKAVKEAFRFTKLIPSPTISTFNMLMSVCASSQDFDGAFQVLHLVREAGLKADCKLYTTLISTCAKCGKVDAMFEVFHEMVNAKVEPNVHTYGALIDGCARAGQVAKAFGAYGIMRSKNVKPDIVVFNALITACGQAGAVDRAFDVLAEMRAETQPLDPDHITVGSLIMACSNAGQVDRAKEVYKMIHEYNIEGTPEVYTIAVNSCSNSGDWDFALSVYSDMTKKGLLPDEMFLSALIDVAGNAGKLDAAFEVLQQAKDKGIRVGIISYGSLMGACSNAKNWQKALELYEDIKSAKLSPTVSTLNALITALCDGDQLQKAVEALSDMKRCGLSPNTITYSILFVASEKMDDIEIGLMLLSQAKKDGVSPNLVMCRSLIGMCLRRFEKACTLGEPILSLDRGRPQIDNQWTSLALMVYRETIVTGVIPTMEVFSQLLGCLRLPHDASLRDRLVENLGVNTEISRCPNLFSLVDGFGEYDPRALSLLEEAASLGIVPCVSFKESPILVDARKLLVHTAEVYLLTVLKGLRHRLAAGAKLPNITILLPVEKTQVSSPEGKKTVNLAGRISQGVGALLRRLRLPYQGNESYGKVRINGLAVKRWFQPKLASPFSGKPEELSSSLTRLGKGIAHQQRNIRTGTLSLY